MKLNKFVEALKGAYGTNLKSVVLYGSAAAEDQGGKTGHDIMIVLHDIHPDQMAKGSRLIRRWMARGNPEPLLIDPDHITSSLDVFPMEFSDMKDVHKILYGDNPLQAVVIDPKDLRLQCEREIKRLILTLRERYIALYPRRRRIARLILESSGSLFAICRAYLRLRKQAAPRDWQQLLLKFNEATECDTSIFDHILAARQGRGRIRRQDALELFTVYLTSLEKVASLVDQL